MKTIVAYSDKSNGNMSYSSSPPEQARQNTDNFLKSYGTLPEQTTRINLSYDTQNFCRYRIIDDDQKGIGILSNENVPVSDAIIVTKPNHAIFLLLADCVGAVLFDPENNVLMLSHLGRHSLEQNGFYQSVEFLKARFNSRASHLKIWLSPSAGKDAYPLYNLGNKGLKEVLYEQIANSGVIISNVTDNQLETTSAPNLFSHTLFVNGKQEIDGRQAMVAMMFD